MKIPKNTLERINDTLNQSLLTQKYQGSPPNTFYGLEAYDTH